jgi:hypothetical protein
VTDVAQTIKQSGYLKCFIDFHYNTLLKSQQFGLHFNNILLGVKFVLLSRNTVVIHQTY